MLNERGIKAVTASALNTPAGPNYSPTVTPCNSPEGSPPRDSSPEPPLITNLLYSGADMIRRKLVGESTSERTSRLPARSKILLSRQEKRALRSMRLVEKVESIGLDNIIHSSSHNHPVGISPLALGSVRSRTASPMTQLTSLKNISHQRRSEDPYAMDRETVRAVLNKGLSRESLNSDISTDGSTTSSVTNRGSSSDSTIKSQLGADGDTPSAANSNPEATRTPKKVDPRVKQMQRQKSRRSLINSGGGQRPDLGTVGGNNSSNKRGGTKLMQKSVDLDDDDQSSVASEAPHQTITQSFVGSISSLFFGRKGGLL